MGGWVGKNANLVRIEKTIGIYGQPLTVFSCLMVGKATKLFLQLG